MITSPQAYRREQARNSRNAVPAFMHDPRRQQARLDLQAAHGNLPDPIQNVNWAARQAPVTAKHNDMAVLLEDDGNPDAPLRNRFDLQEVRAAKIRAGQRAPTRPSASTNPLLADD
jgi:hypothetical protein